MNATIEKHKIIASSRSRQLTQEVIEYQQMPEGPEKQAKCEKINALFYQFANDI